MFDQMTVSFYQSINDPKNPYTYEQTLAHYCKLWQDYCTRKKKTKVKKDFLYEMLKPEESYNGSFKFFEWARKVKII